jgi:hypothetical protein
MSTNDLHGTLPACIVRDQAYLDARKFKDEIRAGDEVEYGWVWNYAKDLWAHRTKVNEILDNKADAIIRYVGGGAGLFLLGSLLNLNKENAFFMAWSLPAAITAVVSLVFATLARLPSAKASLPHVASAVEFANHYKLTKHAKCAFLGQFHLSLEILRLSCNCKSRYLKWSTWFYVGALAALSIPLGIGVVHCLFIATGQ